MKIDRNMRVDIRKFNTQMTKKEVPFVAMDGLLKK